MGWMGYDYDYDYEEYDDYGDYQLYYPSGHGHATAQVGYGHPSIGYAGPSGSGGHQSSYSSYSPYQVAAHPQQFSYNARKDE